MLEYEQSCGNRKEWCTSSRCQGEDSARLDCPLCCPPDASCANPAPTVCMAVHPSIPRQCPEAARELRRRSRLLSEDHPSARFLKNPACRPAFVGQEQKGPAFHPAFGVLPASDS